MPNEVDIRFSPVSVDDLNMLREWISRPHWQAWWGKPETEIRYIKDMLNGSDTTRPFVFFLDGRAAGYIQYWFIGDHQSDQWLKREPWLALLDQSAIGVDLGIADEIDLSKGYGTLVLQAFVRKLRGEGFTKIIIDPDQDNKRAIKTFEKAGFKVIDELLGKTGDCVMMQHEGNSGAYT